MKCTSCGRDISVFKRSCPYCHYSATPLLDGSRSRSDRVGPAPQAGIASLSREKAAWKLKQSEKLQQDGLSLEDEFSLFVSRQELFQISQMVLHCPHVQSNGLYQQRASETSLVFLQDLDLVNALAADFHIEGVPDEPPLIVLFQGLCRAVRLISLALGACKKQGGSASRDHLRLLIQNIGQSLLGHGGKFPASAAGEIMRDLAFWNMAADRSVLQWSRSYSAAMNMGIISHELGHIALGHTLGMAVNAEVSRNQEREADSFAASVISSSPFSDYMVEGMVFFWILLAWANKQEIPQESCGEISHPDPRERLFDFIRANREQADLLGLDAGKIEGLLP